MVEELVWSDTGWRSESLARPLIVATLLLLLLLSMWEPGRALGTGTSSSVMMVYKTGTSVTHGPTEAFNLEGKMHCWFFSFFSQNLSQLT